MIRRANNRDIPQLMALAVRAHDRSIYRAKADMDVEHAKRVWAQAMAMPNACIFVSDDANGLNGCIVGATSNLYEFLSVPLVMDQFFYVDEGAGASTALELMQAMWSWANEKFERFILRHAFVDAISGATDREWLMGRLGFRQSGHIYEREVGI